MFNVFARLRGRQIDDLLPTLEGKFFDFIYLFNFYFIFYIRTIKTLILGRLRICISFYQT